MADEVADQVDGSVSAAAALFTAALDNEDKQQAAQPAPQPAPEPEQPVEPLVETAPEVPETPIAVAPEPPKPAQQPNGDLTQRLRDADKAKADAEQVRTQYLDRLNNLVPQMEAAIKGEFADIKNFDDLSRLARENPQRYNDFVIANAKLQAAQQAQTQAQQEQQKVAQQRHTEWQASEQEKLGNELPELRDPDKGPVLARKIHDYAIKSGYTPQQLSLASANDFLVLHKAMQFEGLEAAKKIAQEKAAKAPPVQQPGTQRTTSSKEDKLQSDFDRLRKTGHVDDAAAVFSRMLSG